MKSTVNIKPVICLFIIILLLSCIHVYYLILSHAPPSWDEAHYLQGAVKISKGLKDSFSSGWEAYRTALGMKPPLVCVPAGLLIWIFNGEIFTGMLSMVIIFCFLGLTSYSLFRNLFDPLPALFATGFLLLMPMITGLTHRFYTENLLLTLCVLSMDVLLRYRFRSFCASIVTGFLVGLGLLTKLSFLVIIFLPMGYIFLLEIIKNTKETNRIAKNIILILNICTMILVSTIVAQTWYGSGENTVMTYQHAMNASQLKSCWYPTVDSILANISSGPSVPIFLLSLIGLCSLLYDINLKNLTIEKLEAWVAILLIAGITFAITTISINKATRFSVTWLPAIAALATYPCYNLVQNKRIAAGIASVFALILFIMMLHNSFNILPFARFAIGKFIFIDNRYPLNVPDWFNDNHPVDRNPYPWDKADDLIADDAKQHFPNVTVPVVRLTMHCLVFNHDYFNLLALIRNHPMVYLYWYGISLEEPERPHYIIHGVNFHQFHNEKKFSEFYPAFHNQVDLKKIAYKQINLISGPQNSKLYIYRKN